MPRSGVRVPSLFHSEALSVTIAATEALLTRGS
jgi:hypothetical protein